MPENDLELTDVVLALDAFDRRVVVDGLRLGLQVDGDVEALDPADDDAEDAVAAFDDARVLEAIRDDLVAERNCRRMRAETLEHDLGAAHVLDLADLRGSRLGAGPRREHRDRRNDTTQDGE